MKIRHIITALALVAASLCVVAPQPARAACGSIPYYFVNATSIVDAVTTNANNAFLIGCATSVDNSQIGAAGIFPSQVISTGVSTGTFGGAYPYRFMLSSATQVPLSIYGATSQSADFFDIFNNGGSQKYLSVNSSGTLTEYGQIAAGGGAASGGALGDITAGRSISQGVLWLGFGTTAQTSFIQGYGGTISLTPVSSAVGTGVSIGTGGTVSATSWIAAVAPGTGSASYVPPIYTQSGSPVSNTAHTALGSCTMNGTNSCGITFTGGAAFTGQGTYGCGSGTNGSISFFVQQDSASVLTLYAASAPGLLTTFWVSCTGY